MTKTRTSVVTPSHIPGPTSDKLDPNATVSEGVLYHSSRQGSSQETQKRLPGDRRRWLPALAATISLGLLAYLVSEVDWAAVQTAWRSVAIDSIVLSLVALAASVLLGARRLQILARGAGHDVAFANALSAVGLGQLAGIFFFQIFGQLLMHGALLRGSGVPAATSVFLTLYERLMALFLLVIFSLVGAVTIFGAFGIDTQSGGSDSVRVVIGGIAVCSVAGLLAWGAHFRSAWHQLEPGFFIRTTRNAIITTGIQLCTLAAFVALSAAVAPDISLYRIAAASTIVMFASALPISMAGWGVREMSAVFALGAIGFPALQAVLIGILRPSADIGLIGSARLHAQNDIYVAVRPPPRISGAVFRRP